MALYILKAHILIFVFLGNKWAYFYGWVFNNIWKSEVRTIKVDNRRAKWSSQCDKLHSYRGGPPLTRKGLSSVFGEIGKYLQTFQYVTQTLIRQSNKYPCMRTPENDSLLWIIFFGISIKLERWQFYVEKFLSKCHSWIIA